MADMKRPIFISGTGTNVGKTYVTSRLIKELSGLGLRVGVFKPIETGVRDIPADASLLFEKAKRFNPELATLSLSDICPVSFALAAGPAIAKGTGRIDFEALETAFEKISAVSDIVLIEGAGGLLTPIEGRYFMLNLAEMFDSRLLLVSHAKLGCINDILLNEKVLKIGKQGFVIAVNKRSEDYEFDEISLPYLEKELNDLYILPEEFLTLAQRIASWE